MSINKSTICFNSLASYNVWMEIQPKQPLDNVVLKLPEDHRANLALWLVRSLDPAPDPSADVAWAAEIETRVQPADNCSVELKAWNDVIERMRRRHNI